MRHWLTLRDYSPRDLQSLVALARDFKASRADDAASALRGKILGMVFFNPSLRTRVSFESAMLRHGGHAISLSVGGDTWQLEHRDGAIMNGDRSEHVREAAPVLGRYCNALGVRTFARLTDAGEDAADAVLQAFAKLAGVPVISMESAIEHPCQALADHMTLVEKLGEPRKRNFTLTWAPHIKPLPMAVPHSALLAAASAGMNITLAHPAGYDLNVDFVSHARTWCESAGASFTVTHDQRAACKDADAVYVKSWGASTLYGKHDAQTASFREHADWMVTPKHLVKRDTVLMHCLPVRRNVVISDAALDDMRCIVVDQAENRMWAQSAILSHVFSHAGESN